MDVPPALTAYWQKHPILFATLSFRTTLWRVLVLLQLRLCAMKFRPQVGVKLCKMKEQRWCCKQSDISRGVYCPQAHRQEPLCSRQLTIFVQLMGLGYHQSVPQHNNEIFYLFWGDGSSGEYDRFTSTKAEQASTETVTVAESITPFTKLDNGEASDSTGMTAQTVIAVATGSSINMEELERRRLFVPGILYHIKRLRQHKEGTISLPTSPGKFMQAREEAFRSLESKYVVVRGLDPNERFGRIIVSKTMISDHSCPSYIRGLSLALSSCPNS